MRSAIFVFFVTLTGADIVGKRTVMAMLCESVKTRDVCAPYRPSRNPYILYSKARAVYGRSTSNLLTKMSDTETEKKPVDAKPEEKVADVPETDNAANGAKAAEAESETSPKVSEDVDSDKKRAPEESDKPKKKRRRRQYDDAPKEEPESDDGDEKEEAEEENLDDEEEDLLEIDESNIISGGRRTRGKVIDFKKAAEEIPDEEEEDDGEFEAKDEPAA